MKIGLIAMSGIRVVDQELLDLGLNLPGFVERSKTIASLPSLGLLTLAGATPEKHELGYIEMPELPDVNDPLPGPFDVVALSSFTAMIEETYQLADRYRSQGVRVVLGGLHVSSCPDEALRHADAIVIGEAEELWPQVLADIENGRLKQRYWCTKVFDLATAPMPRFDLLDIDRYNRLTVQTSRGCPWSCDFCASSIRLRPGYRTKPVAKVLAEIHRIKELWSKPFIEFADDNTFADKRYGHRLMDALADEEIRWFTETDISIANDETLLKKMAQSGCAQVLIGLEDPTSGTEGIELKANWKARQHHGYIDAIRRIQDHGITVNGCFVLGLDTHTPESFDSIWRFIETSGLYEVQLTLMTPFPATPLYDRLKNEGRLHEPFSWDKRTLFDITFQPRHMSISDLRQGFFDLAQRVYSQEFTNLRRNRFKQRLLSLRRARSPETRSGASPDRRRSTGKIDSATNAVAIY